MHARAVESKKNKLKFQKTFSETEEELIKILEF